MTRIRSLDHLLVAKVRLELSHPFRLTFDFDIKYGENGGERGYKMQCCGNAKPCDIQYLHYFTCGVR